MQNISFLLWTEVVQWFNLENTSSMRYMEKTKQFWKLGMRHFGGKFIRFMTGFKNTSYIVFQTARKGQCDQNNSDVNFAVPNKFSEISIHMDSAHLNGILVFTQTL